MCRPEHESILKNVFAEDRERAEQNEHKCRTKG